MNFYSVVHLVSSEGSARGVWFGPKINVLVDRGHLDGRMTSQSTRLGTDFLRVDWVSYYSLLFVLFISNNKIR